MYPEYFKTYFDGIDEDILQKITGYEKENITELRHKIAEVDEMDISEAAKTEMREAYLRKIADIKESMQATLKERTRVASKFIESL